MRDIEVFCHLFIPPNESFRMWTWWIDEQIAIIKESKLCDIATINMAITMPKLWITDPNHPSYLSLLVVDYIKARYPFVKILDIRDTGETNIFEGQTLKFVHRACMERDIDVLYIHSKGYFSNTAYVSSWRQILNHFTIREWPRCLKYLDRVDVVGIKDANSLEHAVSGNFWWSKSEYIRKLPEPIDSSLYHSHADFHPDGISYRYAFEEWISLKRPAVHHMVDTRTDHYKDYCFLERLTQKQ
jgi:hypothetical protein